MLSAALPVLGLPETRGKPLVQTVDQVDISRVFDDVGDVDDGEDSDDGDDGEDSDDILKRQVPQANSRPG